MFLPEDDSSVFALNDSSDSKSVKQYVPSKRLVCKFFYPKGNVNCAFKESLEYTNHLRLAELQNPLHYFACNKSTIYRKIACVDYDEEMDISSNAKSNEKEFSLQSVVIDDAYENERIKIEKNFSCVNSNISQTSSSLSTFADTNGFYSASTTSCTYNESNCQEPKEDQPNLVVKNVYSMSGESQLSNEIRTTGSSSHECINAKENVVTELITESPCTNLSTENPLPIPTENKIVKKSIRKSNKIIRARRSKKDSNKKETNTPVAANTNDQPVSSGEETDAMVDEDEDIRCQTNAFVRLHQPQVVLQRLPVNNVAKRKSDKCNNSEQPVTKQSKKLEVISNLDTNEVRNETVGDTMTTENTTSIVPENMQPEFCGNKNKSPNKLTDQVPMDLFEEGSFFCFTCQINSKTFCKLHPVRWILNEKISCPYIQYSVDKSFHNFFRKSSRKVNITQCKCNQNSFEHIQTSLPKEFLLRESSISDIGIWTRVKLYRGTIIGPYLGDIELQSGKTEMCNVNPYSTRCGSEKAVMKDSSKFQDAFKSNWMKLVKFTDIEERGNLRIYQYDCKVFFQVVKNIASNAELLVFEKSKTNLSKMENKPIPIIVPVKLDSKSHDDSKDISTINVLKKTEKELSSKTRSPSKENIAHISKILQSYPKITSTEALNVLHGKYPKFGNLSENFVAGLLKKLKLKSDGKKSVKAVDGEVVDFIKETLVENPDILLPNINTMLTEKFPEQPKLNNKEIIQIMFHHNLRRLKGIRNNVDKSMVEAVIDLFVDNPRLTPMEGKDKLKRRFPLKPVVSEKSINNILNLNFCRSEEEVIDLSIDQEVIKEVHRLTKEHKSISVHLLFKEVSQQFPTNSNITMQYIDCLLKKLNVKVRESEVKFNRR